MTKRLNYALLLVLLFGGILKSQAQHGWFTPAVAQAIGIKTCAKCPAPDYRTTIIQAGKSTVYSKTFAVFDTIATYAIGRVVDKQNHQSIKGAQVIIRFCSAFRSEVETKTVTTDANGLFYAGWVGTTGPRGLGSNHLLLVRAPNHESANTEVVLGGAVYLHIELATVGTRP